MTLSSLGRDPCNWSIMCRRGSRECLAVTSHSSVQSYFRVLWNYTVITRLTWRCLFPWWHATVLLFHCYPKWRQNWSTIGTISWASRLVYRNGSCSLTKWSSLHICIGLMRLNKSVCITFFQEYLQRVVKECLTFVGWPIACVGWST